MVSFCHRITANKSYSTMREVIIGISAKERLITNYIKYRMRIIQFGDMRNNIKLYLREVILGCTNLHATITRLIARVCLFYLL